MKITYKQSPIIYPQPISNFDISVSATYEGEVVLGEFTISPNAGTVLPAGSNEIMIRFVPRDSRFQEISTKATINVETGRPSIEWKSPVPITFPQRLTPNELNAVCSTKGMLRYDPPVGTFLMVGVHDLKVTCTPDDKSFSAVSSTTQIQVLFPKLIDVSNAKATPEVSWRSSKNFVAPYFFDEKSIKASCSVPSRITYDIQLGTKFGPGRQTIKAVCIPLDSQNWNSVDSRFEFEVMTPTLRNSSLFKLNSSALDSSEKKLLLPLRQQTSHYAKFECIAYLNSEMIKISREVALAKKRAKSVCEYVLMSKSIKYSISVALIKGAQKATQRNLLKPFRVDIIASN